MHNSDLLPRRTPNPRELERLSAALRTVQDLANKFLEAHPRHCRCSRCRSYSHDVRQDVRALVHSAEHFEGAIDTTLTPYAGQWRRPAG